MFPFRALPMTVEDGCVKQIRVAVATLDERLRCERTLDNSGITFKLLIEKDHDLLFEVEDNLLTVALELLNRGGFKPDIVPASA